MDRPKVTRITVEYVRDNGVREARIFDIDKGDELPAAIFFQDKAVNEILAPFYKSNPRQMTKSEAKKYWRSTIADNIYGASAADDTSKKMDDSFIKQAWTTPDENGNLLVMMAKMLNCPIK